MSDAVDTAIADNNAATRDNDELFAKALELAPRFDTLANVARAVNDALDIDMTSGAWRGLFVRNPEQRERIRKKLGAAAHEYQRTITIAGNVSGILSRYCSRQITRQWWASRIFAYENKFSFRY